MRVTRRSLLWVVAGLLGIAATAAVAWSASQLTGQKIGLAGEPLSVATNLLAPPAPAHTSPAAAPAIRPRAPSRSRRHSEAVSPTETSAHLTPSTVAATTAAPPPVAPAGTVATTGLPTTTTPPAVTASPRKPVISGTGAPRTSTQPNQQVDDSSGGGSGGSGGGSSHQRDD
jgi:hypothetical protein